MQLLYIPPGAAVCCVHGTVRVPVSSELLRLNAAWRPGGSSQYRLLSFKPITQTVINKGHLIND